jgi:hypothetical protein
LPQLGIRFPNPIPQFQTLKEQYWEYSDDSGYISVVHGDLNASNVLIDGSLSCWVIDFTRTGRAHLLRDFVQFESAIKYSILDKLQISARCELEQALLSTWRLDETPSWSSPDPTAEKALKAILTVRQNARLVMGGKELAPEYLIGLLYHHMDMLRYFEDSVSVESKVCILYAANLTLGRLEQLGFKYL